MNLNKAAYEIIEKTQPYFLNMMKQIIERGTTVIEIKQIAEKAGMAPMTVGLIKMAATHIKEQND